LRHCNETEDSTDSESFLVGKETWSLLKIKENAGMMVLPHISPRKDWTDKPLDDHQGLQIRPVIGELETYWATASGK
jgi:hypothetical protein